jgi:hypothetical protein
MANEMTAGERIITGIRRYTELDDVAREIDAAIAAAELAAYKRAAGMECVGCLSGWTRCLGSDYVTPMHKIPDRPLLEPCQCARIAAEILRREAEKGKTK